MATDAIQRRLTVSRGIRLEYLTVGWNILEGAIAVLSGIISGSVALVGFGIDSAIESFSGAVLLWRLHAEKNGQKADLLDRRALKLVGTGFLLLLRSMWHSTPSARLSQENSRAAASLVLLSPCYHWSSCHFSQEQNDAPRQN